MYQNVPRHLQEHDPDPTTSSSIFCLSLQVSHKLHANPDFLLESDSTYESNAHRHALDGGNLHNAKGSNAAVGRAQQIIALHQGVLVGMHEFQPLAHVAIHLSWPAYLEVITQLPD